MTGDSTKSGRGSRLGAGIGTNTIETGDFSWTKVSIVKADKSSYFVADVLDDAPD